jgi:hypothetical protein
MGHRPASDASKPATLLDIKKTARGGMVQTDTIKTGRIQKEETDQTPSFYFPRCIALSLAGVESGFTPICCRKDGKFSDRRIAATSCQRCVS